MLSGELTSSKLPRLCDSPPKTQGRAFHLFITTQCQLHLTPSLSYIHCTSSRPTCIYIWNMHDAYITRPGLNEGLLFFCLFSQRIQGFHRRDIFRSRMQSISENFWIDCTVICSEIKDHFGTKIPAETLLWWFPIVCYKLQQSSGNVPQNIYQMWPINLMINGIDNLTVDRASAPSPCQARS